MSLHVCTRASSPIVFQVIAVDPVGSKLSVGYGIECMVSNPVQPEPELSVSKIPPTDWPEV